MESGGDITKMIINSKSKILGTDSHAGQLNGSDTHSAGISGTSSMSNATPLGTAIAGSGESFSTPRVNSITINTNTQYLTINTTPPANSIAVIVVTGFIDIGGNSGPALLRRGTTTLTSFSTGGSVTYVDTNTGTSATSYNLFNQGTQCFPKYQSLTVVYVTLTDTHAGVLNGSDTHSAGLSGTNDQRTISRGLIK